MTTIGILGAGQLGRMLALAGYPLGFTFRFYDPTPGSPAGRLAPQTCAGYDDLHTLDAFSAGVDMVTYEFENVPVDAVRRIEHNCPVYPPPQALEAAQDRLAEKTLFETLQIPTPLFHPVGSAEDLLAAIQRVGLPALLKTRRLGYDGKGQALIQNPDDALPAWESLGSVPAILEQWIPFDYECSTLALRTRAGEVVFYPLVFNRHVGGILRLSYAGLPQPDSLHLAAGPNPYPHLETQAQEYTRLLLEKLAYVGILCVEWFARGGQLFANEIAPRVHNSGHWTIEGAATSQFQNHIRAVTGLPPGPTGLISPAAAMVNLVGRLPDIQSVLKQPVHLHLYDKAPRPGRKLGHITLLASGWQALSENLAELQKLLPWEKITL